MSHDEKQKLGTEPYKGVRDFYPEDMFIQNYIFRIMRETAESFGYEEYTASPLEPADLYKAKSGEEIVNEQTYTFTDRGGREVTIRPEMTPTVARMVAAKRKALNFPIRWYSIPNLFRYEQPQRGRLREHFQLNVDLFGIKNIEGDAEMIELSSAILERFGLKQSDFEIRINSRRIMDYILKDYLKLGDKKSHAISKLIDKKEKLSRDDFEKSVHAIAEEKAETLITMLASANFEDFIANLPQDETVQPAIDEVRELLGKLESRGISNARFDQSLMRGFDYYTGIVFEVFDTDPKNRRSLFGGGRYDELLALFGTETVPTVGFGMGDVTMRDTLETHGLLPAYTPPTTLSLCIMNESNNDFAAGLAKRLREEGVRIAVDWSARKLGDQIKYADKHSIPFVVCIGDEERTTGIFKLKELKTGSEVPLSEDELVARLCAKHA